MLPHDEALSDDGKQGSQFEPKGCHALSDPRNLSIIALLKCPCSFTCKLDTAAQWRRRCPWQRWPPSRPALRSIQCWSRQWAPRSCCYQNHHRSINLSHNYLSSKHPIPRKEEFYNHITSQHGTSRSKRLKGCFLWSTETSPSCITARQALIRAMSTSGSPPSFSWNRR